MLEEKHLFIKSHDILLHVDTEPNPMFYTDLIQEIVDYLYHPLIEMFQTFVQTNDGRTVNIGVGFSQLYENNAIGLVNSLMRMQRRMNRCKDQSYTTKQTWTIISFNQRWGHHDCDLYPIIRDTFNRGEHIIFDYYQKSSFLIIFIANQEVCFPLFKLEVIPPDFGDGISIESISLVSFLLTRHHNNIRNQCS